MRYFIFIIMLLNLYAVPSWSADQQEISVQLTAQRVEKNSQGREVLSPGDVAKPGEIIEYRIVYKNNGKDVVRNLQGILPIPAEMEYLSGTSIPANVSASLDGKTFGKIPMFRSVKLADGSLVTREVPPSEYRALRWSLPDLVPGNEITVRARTRIKNDRNGLVSIKSNTTK